MSGCSRAANTNHGKATAANNNTPLNQGRAHTLRHCRVHVTQRQSTKPGSNKPIKPLLKTAIAQAMNPARAQHACTPSACIKALAKHHIPTPIQVATIMSWFTYWPPIKNAKLLPNIQAARLATATPAMCRAHAQRKPHIKKACSTTGRRAAQGLTPSTAMALASNQYSKGGL